MCGRLTLRTPPTQWCQQFLPNVDAADFSLDVPARYNIAPTQPIVCVLRTSPEEDRTAAMIRWGLVPSWADDLAIGNRMINARSETVEVKPSFRHAFSRRRCLIVADGYYEWKKTDDGKQPYLFEGDGVLAMAGLWEENSRVSPDQPPLRTCTILTTAANQTVSSVHDRMPVLVVQEHFDRWLDPNFRDIAVLKSWLAPAAENRVHFRPVSRHVNNARNEDASCIESLTS